MQFHPRVVTQEPAEHQRQQRGTRGGERPQPQAAALQPRQVVELGLRRPQFQTDAAGARREDRARVGEPHAAREAFEQRLADLVLEAADLLGDGGHRVVQLLRGRREGTGLRHVGQQHHAAHVEDHGMTFQFCYRE